jgi:hypothetical protein
VFIPLYGGVASPTKEAMTGWSILQRNIFSNVYYYNSDCLGALASSRHPAVSRRIHRHCEDNLTKEGIRGNLPDSNRVFVVTRKNLDHPVFLAAFAALYRAH